MGVVFKGKQVYTELGAFDYVAIKILRGDLSQESVLRARREASIQIVHENLVRMYDFVETTDNRGIPRYHVISEYLEGETLDKIIGRGLLSQEKAVKYAKNVLAALYMLHSKGYIHRDIDPSNVMVCKDGKVKLIDFGIAKRMVDCGDEFKNGGTQEGIFIGKVHYASPEQVAGQRRLSLTSDIYSTGILLYQLLTGELPFTGKTYDVLKAHRELPVPRNDRIRGDLQYVVRKATAKKAGMRYQSASEFIVDLEKTEKRIPIEASRKKWLYAAAGVCLLFLIFFGLGKYRESRQNRFRETLAEASQKMSVALYQEAFDLYKAANRIVRTDSVSQTIQMLEILAQGVTRYIRSDYAGADSLFRIADSLRSSDACYYLGEMSYEGVGTPKDFRRGFDYTSKAARMGNKLAEYRLGLIYQNGIDVEADYDKAVRYFENAGKVIDKGTEANNPEFQFVKANMYRYGNGVQQNLNRAVEYYESAAKLAYPQAQYELYEMLNKEAPEKARAWLVEAAGNGYPKAAYRLGALLIGEQNYKEGVEWTLKAAEANYSPAFRQLGAIRQKKGKSRLTEAIQQALGIEGNDSLSHSYTVKALQYDFDNYLAMFDAGMDYLRGNGVEKNLNEAVKYFEMAKRKVEQLPYRMENGKRIYNEIQHPFAETIRTFNYAPYVK
jgi:TPR repeat protein